MNLKPVKISLIAATLSVVNSLYTEGINPTIRLSILIVIICLYIFSAVEIQQLSQKRFRIMNFILCTVIFLSSVAYIDQQKEIWEEGLHSEGVKLYSENLHDIQEIQIGIDSQTDKSLFKATGTWISNSDPDYQIIISGRNWIDIYMDDTIVERDTFHLKYGHRPELANNNHPDFISKYTDADTFLYKAIGLNDSSMHLMYYPRMNILGFIREEYYSLRKYVPIGAQNHSLDSVGITDPETYDQIYIVERQSDLINNYTGLISRDTAINGRISGFGEINGMTYQLFETYEVNTSRH